MAAAITIQRATVKDTYVLGMLVGELLNEIMNATGTNAFNFNLDETMARLNDFIEHGKYCVFIAHNEQSGPVGFISLFEGHALYAEGSFGVIPELFVRPAFRSQNVGLRLVEEAKVFGRLRGWKRLEVTTPPLPQFDKTLAFYQREAFTITGGRKLKVML